MNTDYHAKYFAHELLRRTASNNIEKLSMSLFNACVDINPHQVEAALFAFRSPLNKGVILADEVGLGKTIEAGLVLCQYWAERRRKLLVICPASLRKQWSMELQEKFNLPSIILEAKNYRETQKQGFENPFEQNDVIITSFNFANRHKSEIRVVDWDLVVIDEAHKLRNVYKTGNKMGQGIKWATEGSKKLLLTATPLQNSLLELYGLSTLIDDHIFGSLAAFRAQYVHEGDLEGLKARLQKFCQRTLRSQVLEYIRYTERRAITRPFRPNDREQELYQALSSFLQREDTYAIPYRQREMTTLILRKLLASSSQAVAGTLETIKQRLEKMLNDYLGEHNCPLETTAVNLFEGFIDELIEDDDLAADILEEQDNIEEHEQDAGGYGGQRTLYGDGTINISKLRAEIAELEHYMQMARSINVDTKSQTLLQALEIGFSEMDKMGAQRKALIFTESRRTQNYLYQFLSASGYEGKIVLFNGTNADPPSNTIYKEWLTANAGTGRISGSRTADKRAALIEYFRDRADIMIATESAAEGVNLQFCSLVVNYDLPWNPQRIEQRIGRCHRYGQKHDVVVINFLNERNEADQRVYELLQQKFNLFNGVLGVSDEVLGTIESGVDFERRILNIYQQCRTSEEIEAAFKTLQEDMEQTIRSRLDDTRRALLENFDADVHLRLKLYHDEALRHLDRFSTIFWGLTKHILGRCAMFNDPNLEFELFNSPGKEIPTGRYYFYQHQKGINRNDETDDISVERLEIPSPSGYIYRLSHPLGEYVLQQAWSRHTPPAQLTFNISKHPVKITVVENLKGQSGYLILSKLTIESFDKEEYLIFNALTDRGLPLDQEICEKMFQCQAAVAPIKEIPPPYDEMLQAEARRHAQATISRSLEESNRHFQEERDRLEKWAEDLIMAAEKELKDTKAKIKAFNRQARQASTTEEQHQIQLRLQELTKLQRRQRQRIFDVEDEIMERRDALIDDLEKRLQQHTEHKTVWTGSKYSANSYGSRILNNMLPFNSFSFPKSIHTVRDCIDAGMNNQNTGLILDYFAGSGTTAHAVINLNREDGGDRKYILVEMGEYFDTVLKPRIQKLIYSKDWRDGKPVSREGSSHLFKYIRLESYEDTLNNLELSRTPEQDGLFKDYPALREEYLLSYMLDIETSGSASLLNIDNFNDPFNYRLKITRHQEMREETVDLVETFNYLIGLRVQQYEPREFFTVTPDRRAAKPGAVKLRKAKGDQKDFTFQHIVGTNAAGEKVLVIWRTLSGDPIKDNSALDAYFAIKEFNTRDNEFDRIYVNGDNNLANLSQEPDSSTWKVLLIEEEFKRLMFDVQDV